MSNETSTVPTSNGSGTARFSKEKLYGTWLDSVKRKAQLSEAITRKALDMPEPDDVNIDQSQRIGRQVVYMGKPASNWGTVGKLALAGGLLATGVGAGAAIPLIISALKPAPVVQSTPTVDTDTDTSGEIMLWPPKGKQ